jgi:hypothetical protein
VDNVIEFLADEPVACPECGSLAFSIWWSGEIWCDECPTCITPTVDFGDGDGD